MQKVNWGDIALVAALILTVIAMFVAARWLEPKIEGPSVPAPVVTPAAPVAPSPAPAPPKPCVAVLTAESCHACKRLEREVLPHLSDLNLITVDVDAKQALAKALTDPTTSAIPQFALSEQSADGSIATPTDWLIGYHSAEQVRQFVAHPKQALEPDPPAASPAAACPPQDCIPAPCRTGLRARLGRIFHR